jgi:hypothetical protein
MARQLSPALEKGQLDHETNAGNTAPDVGNHAGGCGGGASGSQ